MVWLPECGHGSRRRLAAGLALLVLAGACPAAERLTADEIMRRVARNQDASEEGRNRYIHQQSILVRLLRTNGKPASEERREYLVTPKAFGVEKELLSREGGYDAKGKWVRYKDERPPNKDLDLDGDLTTSLAEDFANDKEARDSISQDFFPLTSAIQPDYRFRLKGTEQHQGRNVYAITFEPRKDRDEEEDWDGGGIWKGEVLVDCEEFQPLLVTTQLARKIPLVVRTALGTDLQRLGFKLTYQRMPDGVWFPATYGGEFGLKVLFVYKRRVGLSIINSDFRQTNVDSDIRYDLPKN